MKNIPGIRGQIFRPLANDYQVPPPRGTAEPHGFDEDTKSVDFLPDPDKTIDSVAGNQNVYELVAPPAVDVRIVGSSVPDRTTRRNTLLTTAMSNSETWTNAGGSIDLLTVRQLLPRDDTRVQATFRLSPAVASAGTTRYLFALSQDSNMNGSVVLTDNGAMSTITFFGKEPIYGAVFPIAAYNPANVNQYSLAMITETQQVLDIPPR